MRHDATRIVKPIDRPRHVSLLLPTRGRPEYLDKVFDSIANTVGDAEGIDVWIYVDHDDRITKQYAHSQSYLRYPFKINWVLGERTLSQGQMFNVLREKCTTNPGIYMPFGDDFLFKSTHWDEVIRAAFETYPDRIGLGYIPQPDLPAEQVIFPILSAQWTNVTGRIFTEFFPFWSDDTWLDHVSQMVGRKARIDVQVEAIDNGGKTARLKNLVFWQSFFTRLMDERLAEAKLLLRAIYPQDCSEYEQCIREAEKLAETITEQREKVTASYLLALEKKHSSFPKEPQPHLRLIHSALEAKAVGRLFAKTDSLIQAGDFNAALKMLTTIGLAEQEYKNADFLQDVCRKHLQQHSAPAGCGAVKSLADFDCHKAPLVREPRFFFVMIVLNGMPFIEYSLKSIYEFAHEVIIVEGAVEKCMFAANLDGSSTDGTVEFIKSFPDPQNKIRLIQGKWPEKCEMQNVALRHVTGDYVWLIDSDEVYKAEHLDRIKKALVENPSITQVNFIPDNFWKGLDHIFVSPRFFEPAYHYRRLFKYVRGAVFTSHRPPTMTWSGQQCTTEQMHLLDGQTTRKMGVVPFHYSYVLDKQVWQKIELYHRYDWGRDWNIDLLEWYKECFLKWTPENKKQIEARYPVWTGDRNSYTEPFEGTHPQAIIPYILTKSLVRPSGAAPLFVMQHVIESIREIKAGCGRTPISAVETGTIRSYNENHLSTYHIAKELGGRGRLISVDISGDSIRKSRNICYGATNIEFVQSDSIQYLKNLHGERFHFALLDSANDKDVIFDEFRLIAPMMAENGILMVDDAGITADGRAIDVSVPAQKGHRAWQFLRDCGAKFSILTTPGGHGTQLKIVFTKDNLAKIMRWFSSLNDRALVPGESRKRVRVAADYVQTGTQIETESSFGAEIRKLFTKIRPRKIIETGTYLGTGTTTIIATSLDALGIDDAVFYTIEVNPEHYARAKAHFAANNMNVQALHGLSLLRSMLPDRDEIARRTITHVDYDGIFVDHKEDNRVELYYSETDFPQAEDDLLYKCLERFDFRPDFVLLDSGGHIGSIEFDYLIENLQGECYIALDDIYHTKHHRSFQRIQSDPRFEVITASKEKFGFCIAHFTPEPAPRAQAVRHLLWVRTDSIGDAILASSMLPFIREKYGTPKITVVCRSHIAELYESCPYVDDILTFDEKRMRSDSAYASGVLENVKSLGVDCALNAVYSRDIICDLIVAASGAPLRIGMHGNLCNISEQDRAKHNQWYTNLLPSEGERKPELLRHVDFLRGLGCEVDKLTPQLWLGPQDEAFADEWFARQGLRPRETVALFAGVQSPERIYAGYGKAIAAVCRENGFSVVALGAGSDRELNRRNLEDIEDAGARVYDLSGALTLRQSAAIIKRCRLAVGAETGLAHIAAVVGTPHVIVIGGGQFGRFMPYSASTSLVCLPLECYGCGWKCTYRQSQIYCIVSVAPSLIERAVRQTLSNSSNKPRLFVQIASLWNPKPGEPKWKMFDELLDVESVEVGSLGRSVESERPAGRPAAPCDVSIVVATKDRAVLLDEMLASLKEAAEGINYEVIVVEGGSADHTRQVLHKHGVTQVYVESEHLGPGRHSWSQLYDLGFSKAHGTWAMYASDDLVFEKGSLARAVSLLQAQKASSVAGGVFFYREIIPDYPGWERQGICFALGHKLLMNFGLIRLDVFKELGGFDSAYVFRCPDIDLTFKVYQSGRQLIPLAGCLLVHNNVQDELKKKNLRTADTDYEYLLKKWKHFVPSKLNPPKRLFWDPSYETAFLMPRELDVVDAGLEHYWHGIGCMQIGRFQEATQWFSRALNASCRHWTLFWLVAETLYQVGLRQEAQKIADFVLQANPGCTEIRPLLTRLGKSSVASVFTAAPGSAAGPVIITPRSHFVIEVKHGGIGDHLFYSHLPRIAKQSGKYDKVYVSSRSQFRSEEYRKLIWELNPYVDGFCEETADYPIFDSVEDGMNILDKIMLLRGLDDGKRFHEPELYLRCRPRSDLSEAVIYDPNFVSYVGNISAEAIESFLRDNDIRITHQMKLWQRNFALNGCGVTLHTPTLLEFCRVVASCKRLLCLSSGTATLAAALGKAAIVFYGDGQKKMFHHSRLHKYVNCSGKAPPLQQGLALRPMSNAVQM
jgi:ADP-heptose:LPS heptosyltransferase/glycosyltransferase involved in cell wall biosynthesis/predicted O-methyltransferase YrrM